MRSDELAEYLLPDSFVQGIQGQLSVVCGGHCVYSNATQHAHAISFILEDVAFVTHYHLHLKVNLPWRKDECSHPFSVVSAVSYLSQPAHAISFMLEDAALLTYYHLLLGIHIHAGGT